MTEIFTKIVPSTEKCFIDQNINDKPEVRELTMLKNERLNFQLAFTIKEDARTNMRWLDLDIKGELSDKVTVRRIDNVPVTLTTYPWSQDDDMLRREPGLFPDILSKCEPGKPVSAARDQLLSLFITVEDEKGIEAGEYELTFTMSFEDASAKSTLKLTVIDAMLPGEELIHSQWFHNDCIATYYDCEMFSDRHFELIGNYMEAARRLGINMILTPVLTPPIDTAVGGERPTAQLVDVTVTNGKYGFSFEKFDRYVSLALSKGMKYFEISHFFAQWGASCAPKVMATVDGEYKQIFGWNDAGTGDAYRTFLREFVTALTAHIRELSIADRCYFHISDEPHLDQLENYVAAKNTVADLLSDFELMDALSDYAFYETGAVGTPVPSTDHAKPFIEADVPELWVYYCCGQHTKVSNRFVAMPGQRTRMLGTQLFKFNVKGFLQWGFNFWYSHSSRMEINPFIDASGSNWVPAGDAYSVYPGRDGKAIFSLHSELLYEALQDLRALRLLETKIGHDAVVKLMEDMAGSAITFEEYPREQEYVHALRKAVNEAIANA